MAIMLSQHCRKKGAARRPSTWEMMVAGASMGLMMELLPIPSGLRKRATFGRARLPASHYSVAISTIISGSSLLPIADPSTTFCHCDWHLSLTASVRATALCDTMDSCLTVPELPEPSQVLDFCHLSCIFSAYQLGGRPQPASCGLNWTVSHWRWIIFCSSHSLFLRKLLIPFPHPWGGVHLGYIFQWGSSSLSSFSRHVSKWEKEGKPLCESIFLPTDLVLWYVSCLRIMASSMICRGSVSPISIPYDVEDAVAPLLFSATNPSNIILLSTHCPRPFWCIVLLRDKFLLVISGCSQALYLPSLLEAYAEGFVATQIWTRF